MKRVLLISNVITMISQFNMDNINILQSMGYQVHVACNLENTSFSPKDQNDKYKKELIDRGVMIHQIDFGRRFGAGKNVYKCIRQIGNILSNERFEFIHCHSQIAGLCGRIAARNKDIKTVYTAHGFMFYKNAPRKNWLIFYPMEWFCSWGTDLMITINQEDYDCARKRLHAKRIEYMPGIGIDTEKFNCADVDIDHIRKMLELERNHIFLLSVGELSVRKNHLSVIKAIKLLNDKRIKYYICGKGELEQTYKTLIEELDLSGQVKLLGYRTDICELCSAADLFVFPSLQEGLPVSLMEAMACGTAIVCSRIRGNMDLIKNDNYIFEPLDVQDIANKMAFAIKNDNHKVINENRVILKKYDIKNVNQIMKQIYKEIGVI